MTRLTGRNPVPPPYSGAMSAGKILATDMDGTFLGDDPAMFRLWRLLEQADITLIFSTGRHLPAITSFYEETGTARRARACVCMVGTEIWHLADGGYEVDEGWSDVIADGWDRNAVADIVGAMPGTELQHDQWQSAFKSSWYLTDGAAEKLDRISQELEARGLSAKIVYSAGRYLDLLPARSGKGEAVRYLARHLGARPDEVVTAGDTGNDLDMMRPELGFRGIAVGNSTEELASFHAPNVYHARAPHAAGIEEGLRHYGWL